MGTSGRFKLSCPDLNIGLAVDLEPGATACLPLGTFVDGQGRPWSALGEPAREVTITAFRRSRFRTVNAERRVSGRWPLD